MAALGKGTPFCMGTFDSITDRDDAFDYLCECLSEFITTRRVKDRIYVTGVLTPENEYGNDFRYWLNQAFCLDGSVTENIIANDPLFTFNTNAWNIEVQPLTKSLTMKLCHATKVRHGYY